MIEQPYNVTFDLVDDTTGEIVAQGHWIDYDTDEFSLEIAIGRMTNDQLYRFMSDYKVDIPEDRDINTGYTAYISCKEVKNSEELYELY